jgi:hypothetical protein
MGGFCTVNAVLKKAGKRAKRGIKQIVVSERHLHLVRQASLFGKVTHMLEVNTEQIWLSENVESASAMSAKLVHTPMPKRGVPLACSPVVVV